MAGAGKMPPQLVEHFKSKQGGDDDKKDDNAKRKEAVNKSRTRLEQSSRSRRDQQKETGKGSS